MNNAIIRPNRYLSRRHFDLTLAPLSGAQTSTWTYPSLRAAVTAARQNASVHKIFVRPSWQAKSYSWHEVSRHM